MESLFEALRFTPSEFALVFVTVAIGALVQGSIGFGLNLIVVPIVALIQPAALPAAMIIMALPMTAGSALREREGIDRKGVIWATTGRIPGVALGAWIVSRLEPETLALLIGGFVVLASFLSVVSPHFAFAQAAQRRQAFWPASWARLLPSAARPSRCSIKTRPVPSSAPHSAPRF